MRNDFCAALKSIPNEKGFKMVFLNIVSLPKNIDEISIAMSEKLIHILEDLNCDLLKPEPDSATKKIKLLYELYQLNQLTDKATRVTMTTSSLIDHMVTNNPEKIASSGVIHTGISDHSLIFAIRKIHVVVKQAPNTIEIRNMKKFNEQNLLRDLSNQCWEYVSFYADNPNDMWEIWKQLFLEV